MNNFDLKKRTSPSRSSQQAKQPKQWNQTQTVDDVLLLLCFFTYIQELAYSSLSRRSTPSTSFRRRTNTGCASLSRGLLPPNDFWSFSRRFKPERGSVAVSSRNLSCRRRLRRLQLFSLLRLSTGVLLLPFAV